MVAVILVLDFFLWLTHADTGRDRETDIEANREREGQTDRQTDSQTDRGPPKPRFRFFSDPTFYGYQRLRYCIVFRRVTDFSDMRKLASATDATDFNGWMISSYGL